jgi:crotonobetainyl-CoA:carnitine CoA-transferase CaiB-like acyl-CoA transferase
VDVDHPGAGRLRVPGAPYRHSETPWRVARPAPRVGQHNREIYGGELGVSEETLRAYAEAGVI